MKRNGDKSLVTVEGNNEFDFNLYQANLVSPYDQMWLTPSGEVYVVREEYANNYLSHTDYAKRLVNSIPFYERELEEKKNNLHSHRWQEDKEYYDNSLNQEWLYLINEKGYILFSPPGFNDMEINVPRVYFPANLEKLSIKQVNVFLNFYEFNGKMILPKDLEESLYDIVSVKKSRGK